MPDRDNNQQVRGSEQNRMKVMFTEPEDATGEEVITAQESVPGQVPSDFYGGHDGGPFVTDPE